ncbi:MAG: hypothetical protein QOK47_313, partial [Actinomycetota bacterium]|nr:hypothetical protein [Actinomycetota bacterium]
GSNPAIDLLVDRADLRRVKFVPAPPAAEIELRPGRVLLRIESFGFSANNVTYASLGEAMRYWDFFPAPEGWGRVPVWGFAEVVRSSHDEIHEGERVFGYLPMSTHLVVQADRVSEGTFMDGSPHRADLPGVYQRYSRLAGDPNYDPQREDEQALWSPLFMTSFGAADFLIDNELFGAQAVVFSSASSKTALGIAFLLARDESVDRELIAMTSATNAAFCEQLGYYDTVLTYDAIESLKPEVPTLFVDLAGNDKLLTRLTEHLGDNLKHTVVVGATHWDQRDAGGALGGGNSTFFFLPQWIEKRRKEWGPGEFAKRYGAARNAFFPSADGWMKIVHSEGPEAVEAVYREMLDGKVSPEVGHILSLGS